MKRLFLIAALASAATVAQAVPAHAVEIGTCADIAVPGWIGSVSRCLGDSSASKCVEWRLVGVTVHDVDECT